MKKVNRLLLVTNILATIFTLALLIFLLPLVKKDFYIVMSAENLSSKIGMCLAAAQIGISVLGVTFGWLCFFLKESWLALIAAICYTINAICGFIASAFIAVIATLGFFAFGQQRRLNQSGATSADT